MDEITQLRHFIDRHGMTQAELARRLSYKPGYVNKLFCGAEPITDGFRYRFAVAFGWDTHRVIFGASSPVAEAA